MSIDKNLGHATAYGYAKSKGYTGTEEQFAIDLANAGITLDELDEKISTFINTTVPNAIQSVTSEGTTQVANVQNAGQTQTENVNTAGATQVTAVQAKGDEVLDSIPADYTELANDVTDLKSAFDEITDTESETEIEALGRGAGLYIYGAAANRFGKADETAFLCDYIAVEKGKKYRVTATPIRVLSTDYGYVAFSESEPANKVGLTVLVPAESTSSTSVDYTYEATADGYLSVAQMSTLTTVVHFYAVDSVYHVTTDKTLLLSNVPADAKETGDRFALLGYGEAQKADDIDSEYTVVDRYITANGTIALGGADRFTVSWYPIKKGNTYSIHGYCYVGGSGQALVCFDNVYNSDRYHIVKEVIQTGTTTDTEYDITYTPSEDGYIVMPSVSTNRLIVTLTGDVDFQRIYDIEKDIEDIQSEIGRVKDPIKIQLFGDSITDNLWGDKTTWANYITENMRDYNVTVVNDAVGGSGIGHGKSSGTTESHQTEEYNYVYDLVTDGTTLQTDANVIVILVGTNNWASGSTLGDMSSTGYTSVYGALKGIIEYISQNTEAIVFVCTIPQRYNTTDQGRETNSYGEPLNSTGISLADYCEAFIQVSAFYGMPCVHLNESLGWNRLNVNKYCGDGLHPNVTGDKMLAKFICSEIKKHI